MDKKTPIIVLATLLTLKHDEHHDHNHFDIEPPIQTNKIGRSVYGMMEFQQQLSYPYAQSIYLIGQ